MTTGTLIKPYRANWRDTNQYPQYGSKDYERLAWEFIRRSDEYAKLMTVFSRLADGEYHDGIKEESDTVLDGLKCVPKANGGETARAYYERTKQRKKGGRILPPKWLLKSRWYMEPAELLLPEAEFDAFKMSFVPHVVAMRAPKGKSVATFSLPLWPDEIAFRFRLDVSLDKQWADALKRFDSARAEANYTTYSREVNLDYAHFWLRAFDAHHALVKAGAKRPKGSGRWQDEVRAHLEQNPDPQLKDSIAITDHSVEEWRTTAARYINEGKFASLLYKREKTTVDPTVVGRRIVKPSRSVSS